MRLLNKSKIKSIIILGPTASGKTRLGVFLARLFNGEIISADSRQIYRELSIGSGKDLNEYTKEKPTIAHHLIGEISLKQKFSVYHFQKRALELIDDIVKRGKQPFIVGGSSLYVSSLINSYQFADSPQNIEDYFAHCLLIVPYYPRKKIHQFIQERLKIRWEPMINEVQELLNQKVSFKKLYWLGLEYRYLALFLKNEMSEKESFETLLVKIRNFARRQDIWLRKLEKQGHKIYYLDAEDKEEQARKLVDKFLDGKGLALPKFFLSDTYYGPKSQ